MKYLFSLAIMLVVATGCRERQLSYEEVEKKLMKTMNEYLNKQREGQAEFTVKEVIFFAEKSRYLCEFKVKMKTASVDTIGTMKANISKDFKAVERTQ
jgi:hypothetical protein